MARIISKKRKKAEESLRIEERIAACRKTIRRSVSEVGR